MNWYAIQQTLVPMGAESPLENPSVVVLDSEELSQCPKLSGLEKVLCHTPAVRDAKVCKVEIRSNCITGTIVLPRTTKTGVRLACGYLLTSKQAILIDDTGVLQTHMKRLVKKKLFTGQSVGRFFYDILELLIDKDLYHLEEIEVQAEKLEDRILSGQLDEGSAAMTQLRKEAMAWFRYYSQLDEMACELQESENSFFSKEEKHLFHMFENRVNRLREESQLLREYCTQIQTMFQSEIDIRQNRIMKILTLVTTIFFPLSLLVGWYGMNFNGMPELSWEYGYPAVIVVSVFIVLVSLWICKKKKFW
ncbi:magnesium transporter CorA family protein [Solibaculum mannosilyticum]|uniref:Cobalt transporter n=1 Tax=Solibaculum mannosilyticum TaxID=2780922 RepID=A0A7I8D165_9FIRM|nr:CorA family divalent cation transporter [Solibaculum mannosilyticum]BCI60541.1 hypothetical protein C12CBH8_11800 [Solibaculum mannosilyticum]CZT56969.1 Magnesium transport protein CorA [Eubacteriaceae bacterium CHKCI005]